MRRLALLAAAAILAACTAQVDIEGAACDAEHACPDGYRCVDGRCYRAGPMTGVACSEDADCPAGVCLAQAHVCVACRRHEDCVSGLCHLTTHICVGCKGDHQCPSGVCDEETGLCEESSTNTDGNGK